MNIGKLIGGILLVSGTTIGAGLLGLPATCGFMGFYPSIALFMLIWLFMLASSVFFVDVCCDLKHHTNMISMAEKKLGRWGMVVSWISYLLLLYSLMALYISGSAPLFQQALKSVFDIDISMNVAKFILPLFFGWVIYLGTVGVDLINRIMMIGLIIAYFLLVSLLPEHIDLANLNHFAFTPFIYAFPFVIVGFGYHVVIPSIGFYVDYDRKTMIYCVVIGSVLSLVINIIWLFLVLGVLPLHNLAEVWKGGVPITSALASYVPAGILSKGVYFFSFFAILTSFLGVGLSLADFLIDGFKIKKGWEGRLLAIALSFVPPLIFVFSYARGFMLALQYGGAFVAILLAFIPAAMAWKLKTKFYQSLQGRVIVIATMLFAFTVVTVNILIRWGFFTETLEKIGGLSS
ncbi:MAG: Tyrosine-specific transport protein [Chlamydiia bacterium]|nr:Tyrosine-specific transport protein [Chlamydiia bacterium]